MNKLVPRTTVVLVTVALGLASGYMAVILENKESSDDDFVYIDKPIAKVTDETAASDSLVNYTKEEFSKPEIIKVTDDVYVAIGFALGNSIMIKGTDGIIIVDTTESSSSMEEIMLEFRNITDMPVKAIILTHFHTDHILGTAFILEEERQLYPDNKIEIYSHDTTEELMFGFSETNNIGFQRATRQFGSLLPRKDVPITGAGLGPFLRFNPASNSSIPSPTKTYSDEKTFTEAGVTFTLVHTPGETNDGTTIFIHKSGGIAMPGDVVYKCFPNLYAIRGSPARDATQWYKSVDRIRSLGATYLVGSHTRPVVGKEAVYDTLLIYRDAIKYVHDQTLRLLNKGYVPDEIIEMVKLPDRLANHPHLQEHYGTVAWSIRGVFTNYLGWFSGDPKELNPMPAKDHATRMARLVAYAQTTDANVSEILLQDAQLSHEKSIKNYNLTKKHIVSDDKWALELVDTVLEIGDLDDRLMKVAKNLKVSALRAIGVEEVSANGRNYYLTFAMEVNTGIELKRTKTAMANQVEDTSIDRVLRMICAKEKGLNCQYKNYTIALQFTDVEETYAMTLRNSVCDVIEPVGPTLEPQVLLSTTVDIFKSVMVEDTTLEDEIASGGIEVTSGDVEIYKNFMECFDSLVEL